MALFVLASVWCWPLAASTSSYFLPQALAFGACKQKSFLVQQVPGDGGCLFHALAAQVDFLVHRDHSVFDPRLEQLSLDLRNLAVDILERNDSLYVSNDLNMTSTEILSHVSKFQGLSPSEYCRGMRRAETWGGGPEIVALCNHFQCPIHVYSLTTRRFLWKKYFVLEKIEEFGSPMFDGSAYPFHLLSVDGRFPNLAPGEQKATGDHFMALYPLPQKPSSKNEARMMDPSQRWDRCKVLLSVGRSRPTKLLHLPVFLRQKKKRFFR